MRLDALKARMGPMLAARALQLIQGFAISTLVLWRYGLDSAGTYALASFVATCAILLVAFGLPNALPRAAVSQGARATAGLAISSAAAVLAAVAIAAYGTVIGTSPAEVRSLFFLGLAGALGGQVNILQMLCILQERPRVMVVAPLIHLCGAVAAAAAPDFTEFSLALLGTRVAGNVAGFSGLAYAQVRLRALWPSVRDGLRFVPLDGVNLLADQLSTVLIAGLVSRAELGLFGLIRQCLTLADSPGWSFVMSNYPRLVADVRGSSPTLARDNQTIGFCSAAICLALSAILALGVYHQPPLLAAMLVVLLSLPARYANNFCDQALRASGFVSDCLVLSIVKIIVSAALFCSLVRFYGLWGAVLATTLLSLCGGVLYSRQFRARFPETLRSSFCRFA